MANLKQTIYELVEQHPNLETRNIVDVIGNMNFVSTETEIARLVAEARQLKSLSLSRFRNLAADNQVFDLPIENKGVVKYGIISDTHFGSKYHDAEGLQKTVDVMLNSGVKHILCPGDIIDGYDVYRGQVTSLSHVSEDDQIAAAIEGLPVLPKGCAYHWITGNHDLIWHKNATGSDPMISIEASRKDINYLGKYSAYIFFTDKIWAQMIHPMKGNGYGITASAQKYLDGLNPRSRPPLIMFGHWHQPAHLVYKECIIEQCASYQRQNELAVRLGLPAVTGGKIVSFEINKEGLIGRYWLEDILFWEPELMKVERKRLL